MGRLKVIFIVTFCILVGLLFGFFLIYNQQDVLVDLLFYSKKVEISVGRFSLTFFVAGLLTAFVLCLSWMFLQNLELRAARKQVRKLSTQLDKLQELSRKDAA